MKKIIFTFLFLSVLLSCNAQKTETLQKIDVKTFKKAVSKEKVQLVDVRTPREYRQDHVENAININYFSDNFKTKFQKLDKNKPVYIYCRSGVRSGKASKILVKLGFKKIFDLKGGFLAYKR